MAVVTSLGFSLFSTWRGKGLKRARRDFSGLAVTAAGLGLALSGLSSTAVLAGAAVGVALGGIALIFGGIGVAFAAMSSEVQTAYKSLWDTVRTGMQAAAAPMVPVLLQVAKEATASFMRLQPVLAGIFEALAPHMLTFGRAVIRVLEVFVVGLGKIAVVSGPALDALSKALIQTMESVVVFFDRLASIMPQALYVMGQFFGSLGGIMSGIAGLFIWLTQVAIVTVPIVSVMMEGLGLVVRDILMPVLRATIPLFQAIADGFWLIKRALAESAPNLGPAWAALADSLVAVVDASVAVAVAVIRLGATIFAALAPALNVVLGLAAAFFNGLAVAIRYVGDGIAWFVDQLTAMVTWISKNYYASRAFGVVLVFLAATFAMNMVPAMVSASKNLWFFIQYWSYAAKVAVVNGAKMAAAWFMALGPIGWAIAAVAAVVAVIVLFWDKLKAPFIRAWEAIKAFIVRFWPGLLIAMLGPLGVLIVLIVKNWDTVKAATMRVWGAIKSFLSTVWSGIATVARAVWGPIKTFFSTIWGGIRSGTSSAWGGIKSFLVSTWNAIKNAAAPIWGPLKRFLEGLWKGFVLANKLYWNAIKTVILTVWNAIRAAAGPVWNGIKNVIIAVWNVLKAAFTPVLNALRSGWNSVASAVRSAFAQIRTALQPLINTLRGPLGSAMSWLRNLFVTAWTAIRNSVSGNGGVLRTIFSAIGTVLRVVGTIVKNVLIVAFKVLGFVFMNVVIPVLKVLWAVIKTVFIVTFRIVAAVVKVVFAIIVGVIKGAAFIIVGAIRVITAIVRGCVAAFNWFRDRVAVAIAIVRLIWNRMAAYARMAFMMVRNVVVSVFSAIATIFRNIWNGIRNFVLAIWRSMTSAIGAYVNAVRGVITRVLTVISTIWRNIWNGIRNFFTAIWNSIRNYFVNNWNRMRAMATLIALKIYMAVRNVWNTVKNFFVNIWNSITAFFRNAWNNMARRAAVMMLAIRNGVRNSWNAVKNFFVNIWNSIATFFRNIWNGIANNVNRYLGIAKRIIITAWNTVKNFFTTVWTNIANFFGRIWDWIVNKVRSATNTLKSYWNAIKNAFRTMVNTIKNLLNWFKTNVIDRLVNIVRSSAEWVRNKWNWLANRASEIFNAIKDTVANVFDAIKTKVGNVINAVAGYWDDLKDKAESVFNKIKNLVKTPMRWVIDHVYNGGIVKFWNWMSDKLFGGKAKLNKVNVSGWAKGGPVRGPGSWTSDSVPARLSNGEHVWTAREVRAAGGHGAVMRMRSQVLGGRPVSAGPNGNQKGVPALKDGGGIGDMFSNAKDAMGDAWKDIKEDGLLDATLKHSGKLMEMIPDLEDLAGKVLPRFDDKVKPFGKMIEAAFKRAIDKMVEIATDFTSFGGDGGGPGDYKAMYNWIKARVPGTTLTSGYRKGDPGYHGKGQAVDLTFSDGSERRGGGKAKTAYNLIKATWLSAIKELIWDFSPDGKGIGVWNGKPNHRWTSATSRPPSHNDHIHWASGGGGPMSIGQGGNVKRWSHAATTALRMAGLYSPAALAAVLETIRQESNGNAMAVNNWDSNAAAGYPSKGLMQVIGPTFAAYAGSMRSLGVFNPIANIYAAVRYAKARYGSRWMAAMTAPGGYAMGGGVKPVSYDSGGMLQPGYTLVHNGTGKPEPVGHDLLEGRGNVTVNINGTIMGDRRAIKEVVVQAITDAKREKRL